MKNAASILTLCIAGAFLASPAAAQGDAERGAKLAYTCQGCHGIEGWRTAFPEVYKVPRIAGQHPQYFVSALKAYRSGDRAHPSMKGIAATLSDQDMADLAAYYAQPGETTRKASK